MRNVAMAVFAFILISITRTVFASDVEVHIVDGTGVPVARAEVYRLVPRSYVNDAQDKSVNRAERMVRTEQAGVGKTDATGTIKVSCEAGERAGFLVQSAGLAPKRFGFWGCVPANYKVVLEKAAEPLRCKVLDEAGKPLAGNAVRINFENWRFLQGVNPINAHRIELSFLTHTDENGMASIAIPTCEDLCNVDIETDSGWRRVIDNDTQRDYAALSDLKKDEVIVGHAGPPVVIAPLDVPSIQPTLTIHLRVLDDATNEPIRQVRVSPGGQFAPSGCMAQTLTQSALDLDGSHIAWNFYDGAWANFLRVEAEGYGADTTRFIKGMEREVSVEVRLKPPAKEQLAVTNPDGTRAAGAKVYVATPSDFLRLYQEAIPNVTCDSRGQCTLSLPGEVCRLAIYDDQGWAEATPDGMKQLAVKLEKWASATVRVAHAGKPLPGVNLMSQSGISEDLGCNIDWFCNPKTDDEGLAQLRNKSGSFGFSASPPPRPIVGWGYCEVNTSATPGKHLDLSLMSGKTTLRGSVVQYPGYNWGSLYLIPHGKPCDLPEGVNALPEKQRAVVIGSEQDAAPGVTDFEKNIRSINVSPAADGTFFVDGLKPGVYELFGRDEPVDSLDPVISPTIRPLQELRFSWFFVVPESAPDVVDIGQMKGTTDGNPRPFPGEMVPELKGPLLNGDAFDLASLRGRWVVLSIWGSSMMGSDFRHEPDIIDLHEGWGPDGRAAVVSAWVDNTTDEVKRHVAEKRIDWPQVILGPKDKTDVPQRFGSPYYPDLILIHPDGTIFARDLAGFQVRDMLVKLLGPPRAPLAATTNPAP